MSVSCSSAPEAQGLCTTDGATRLPGPAHDVSTSPASCTLGRRSSRGRPFNPSGLFHPDNAPELRPTGLCSRESARPRFRRRSSRVVLLRLSRCARLRRFDPFRDRSPALADLASMPSWPFPSEAFPPAAVATGFPAPPLTCLRNLNRSDSAHLRVFPNSGPVSRHPRPSEEKPSVTVPAPMGFSALPHAPHPPLRGETTETASNGRRSIRS